MSKPARVRSLELDAWLDAFSQSFLRARAELDRRQAPLLAAAQDRDWVPTSAYRIAELSVEFDCTIARARVGPKGRLAMWIGGRRSRAHRARFALHDGELASAELRVDGALVRRIDLAASSDRSKSADESKGAWRRTSPGILLISARDSSRVAAILTWRAAQRARLSPSPSRRRRSRSAPGCRARGSR